MNTNYNNKKFKITHIGGANPGNTGKSEKEIENDKEILKEATKEVKEERVDVEDASKKLEKEQKELDAAKIKVQELESEVSNAKSDEEKKIAEEGLTAAKKAVTKITKDVEELEKKLSEEKNQLEKAKEKKEKASEKVILNNSPEVLRKRAERKKKKATEDKYITEIIKLQEKNKDDKDYKIGEDNEYKKIIENATKDSKSYLGKEIDRLVTQNNERDNKDKVDPYLVYNDPEFKKFLEESIQIRDKSIEEVEIGDLFVEPNDLYNDWTKMITLLGNSLNLDNVEREQLSKSLVDVDLKFIDKKLIDDIKKLLESDLKLAEFEKKNITKSGDKDLISSYTLLKDNLAKMQLLSSQNFLKIKKLITDGADGKNVNDILKMFINSLNEKVGTVNEILQQSSDYKKDEDKEKEDKEKEEKEDKEKEKKEKKEKEEKDKKEGQSGGSYLLNRFNIVNKYLKYKIKYLKLKLNN